MLLQEATKSELLRKCNNETPERYKRRMNYVNSIKAIGCAKPLFIKTGTLTIPLKVQSPNNPSGYIVTIHISGIMKLIREELDKAGAVLPTRPLVYRALRRAVDENDIYVDCTCADYKYRFRYWSTQNNYAYGQYETRPANITNPNNTGAICKHITAALVRPSQWLKYVDTWIATVVKAYLQNKLNITAEDIDDLKGQEAEDVKDDIEAIENLSDDTVDSVQTPSTESAEEEPDVTVTEDELEV